MRNLRGLSVRKFFGDGKKGRVTKMALSIGESWKSACGELATDNRSKKRKLSTRNSHQLLQ